MLACCCAWPLNPWNCCPLVLGFVLATELLFTLAWPLTNGNCCWLDRAFARICFRVNFEGINFIGLL